MYTEKKKIGNNEYIYLKVSARVKDKIKTKTIAYLGKAPMSNSELNKKISAIPESKIESAKKELLNEEKITFLTREQIESLDKIKKSFSKKLKLDKKLIEDMLRDFKTHYIYNTNALEGNTLTLEETSMLLNENRSSEGKELREIYDHLNGREALEYIWQHKPELTRETVIMLHAVLMKNIDGRTGAFRKHNVRVFGADFETSDAKYVEADMGILMRWHTKNRKLLHPLELAAIFHEKFEKIHPFYDGNGRTGRILLNLILLRNRLPPLIITNSAGKEYYKALSEGHKTDLTKAEGSHGRIVAFCFRQLTETHSRIFARWG